MLARALRLHAAGDADGAIAAYRATLLSGAAHETIAAYSNLGSLLVAEGSFAEGLEMGAASARLAPHSGAGVSSIRPHTRVCGPLCLTVT